MAKKKKSNKVLYILLGLVVVLVIFAIVGKSAGWIGKSKEIEKNELGVVEILPFDNVYKDSYKKLILNWLIENQDTEVQNTDLINNPEKFIKSNRTEILLAKVKDDCFGTIVSKNIDDKKVEIFYFVVDEKWKQRQIGRQLLKTLIGKLKENEKNVIVVKLGRKNSYALRIFKDEGFSLQSVNSSDSEKNNTTLLLELSLDEKRISQ